MSSDWCAKQGRRERVDELARRLFVAYAPTLGSGFDANGLARSCLQEAEAFEKQAELLVGDE